MPFNEFRVTGPITELDGKKQITIQLGKLTLRVLPPALGPALLHGVGNSLTAFRAQLAFARCR